jgi:transcriptional regulator with XRE-family HTH domain
MKNANPKDLILKIKEARAERGLSYADIIKLMEEKNIYPVSGSTLSRLFSEGSENLIFSFENTIVPIYNALFDISEIEENDDTNIQAMKVLLKYKLEKINELEAEIERLNNALDKEKVKYHEKLDKERERTQKSIDFLKEQMAYKDKRMDLLLNMVEQKEAKYDKILDLILSCPARLQSKGCE